MAWPMAAGDLDSGTASHSDRYDSTLQYFLISSYRDKGISGAASVMVEVLVVTPIARIVLNAVLYYLSVAI